MDIAASTSPVGSEDTISAPARCYAREDKEKGNQCRTRLNSGSVVVSDFFSLRAGPAFEVQIRKSAHSSSLPPAGPRPTRYVVDQAHHFLARTIDSSSSDAYRATFAEEPREEHTMKRAAAPISFAGSQLVEARHVCAFFNSDDEEYRVLLPFIKDGFECGDKAVSRR